jgi:hypothetical protein
MRFEQPVPVGDEFGETSSYGFPGRAAQKALGSRIYVYDPILKVKHYHAIGHVLYNVLARYRNNIQQPKTEQAQRDGHAAQQESERSRVQVRDGAEP